MKTISHFLVIAAMVLPVLFMQGCKKSVENNSFSADSSVIQTEETIGKAKVRHMSVDVQGRAVLDAILAAYSDNVVLIGFWATWCPPCRQAMKEINEIKPEMISKGVTFVYVTGETSPMTEWREAIAEIEGDHYRLTDAQWESMIAELNMPGIPAYHMVGKNGEVIFSNLTEGGYPGNEVIKAKLDGK